MGTLRQRIQRVVDNVSMEEAYPYITKERVYFFGQRARQVKCFLHGDDSKPSARIYPDGKMYCYTCRRMFDAVSYFASYRGVSFKDYEAMDLLLKDLEREFNLTTIALKDITEPKKVKRWDEILQPRERATTSEHEVDYKPLFLQKWLEVNDVGIRAADQAVRDKIFDGLDLVLLFTSSDGDYKKAWDFLFKLEKLGM